MGKIGDGAKKKDLPSAARMVEQVVGCKWSVALLAAVRRGIHRPGALERELAGISTKVLNERLRKLVRFGILSRTEYPEIPPRVEYHLTPFGARFAGLLDEVERLEAILERERRRAP
ncbi:MAG: hypothetical protein KatS3mg124_2072 [Porticoccaceae bacterium]|nr:MAG: hypothetical protein KatS3mg124_2072 [Porticoccaceae bacterium]